MRTQAWVAVAPDGSRALWLERTIPGSRDELAAHPGGPSIARGMSALARGEAGHRRVALAFERRARHARVSAWGARCDASPVGPAGQPGALESAARATWRERLAESGAVLASWDLQLLAGHGRPTVLSGSMLPDSTQLAWRVDGWPALQRIRDAGPTEAGHVWAQVAQFREPTPAPVHLEARLAWPEEEPAERRPRGLGHALHLRLALGDRAYETDASSQILDHALGWFRWRVAARMGPARAPLRLEAEWVAERRELVALREEGPDGSAVERIVGGLVRARLRVHPVQERPFVLHSECALWELTTRDRRHGVAYAR